VAKAKTPKYQHNSYRPDLGAFVRAWKERREWVVQVWLGETPDGEPKGDWEMPGVLGLDAAIRQAVLQTKD
jgi:hypothetical protein